MWMNLDSSKFFKDCVGYQQNSKYVSLQYFYPTGLKSSKGIMQLRISVGGGCVYVWGMWGDCVCVYVCMFQFG